MPLSEKTSKVVGQPFDWAPEGQAQGRSHSTGYVRSVAATRCRGRFMPAESEQHSH